MSLPGGLTGGATLPDLQQSPADTQRATIEQTRAQAYETAKQQYETTKSAAQQQYQTEIDAAQERYKQAVESAKEDVGDDASPEDVEAAQQRREQAIEEARRQLESDREAAKQTYEQAVQAAQEAYDSATGAADQAAEAATQAADSQEQQQQQIDQQSAELQASMGQGSSLDINKPYVPGTLDTGMSTTEGAVPSPQVSPPGSTPPGTQRIPQPGEDLDQNGIEDILELYEHVVGQGQPGIVGPTSLSHIVGGQNAFTQAYTPRIPGPNISGQPDLSMGQLQPQPTPADVDPTTRVIETAINTVMDRVGIPKATTPPLPGGTGGGVAAVPPTPEPPAEPVLPPQPGAQPRPPMLEDAGSQLQQLIQEQMRIDPVWAPQLYGAPPISLAANKEQQDIANTVNAPRAVELPNSPPTAPQAAGVAVTPQGLEQRAQTSIPSLPAPGASSEPGSFLPTGPATGGGAPPLPRISSPAMGAYNQATAQPAPTPNGSVLFEDSQAGGWVEIPPQGPARLLTFAQAQAAVRAGAVASGPNARNLELRGAQERPDAQAAPYRNAQGQMVANPVAPIEGQSAGNIMPTYRAEPAPPGVQPTTMVAGATDIRTSPEQIDQAQQGAMSRGTAAVNRSSEWAPRGLAPSREQIDQDQQGYSPTNPNAVTTGAPNAWRFDRDMSNPNYSFTRFVQPQGAEAGKLGTVFDQSLAMYDAQKAGTSRIQIRDVPIEEKAIVADAVAALARGDESPKWAIAPLQNAARAAWQKENGDPGIDPKYADPQYVAKWVNNFLEGKTDQPLQKELSEDIRRVGKAPPEDIAASLKGPTWIGKYGRDLGAGVKVDNETRQLAVPQTQEMAARYGLGVQNTLAVCGPIAANAMLRAANGDDSISLDQVWKKATAGPNPYWNGAWTGPVNYTRFLGKEYGKDVELVSEMSWAPGDVADLGGSRMGTRASEISSIMAQDVTEGKPVTVSISGTNGHYFVATDYDPSSNKFYVGTTGTVYRGGATWMSLDQMKTTAGGGGIAAIRFRSPLTGERKGEPVKIVVPGEAPGETIKSMDEIDRMSVAEPRTPGTPGLSRADEWGERPAAAAAPSPPKYAEMAVKPTASEPEIRSLQQRIIDEAPQLPTKPLGSIDETMKAWAPTLQWVENNTGLPAEYVAGIVMAENGFGNSPLSSNSNNYFSIGSNPQYDRFASGVDAGGRFARYPTPQAALARFVGMVAHPENTYNTKASFWKNRAADTGTFVRELVKGGYLDVSEGFPESAWRANIEKGAAQYRRVAGQARQT